MRDPDTLALYDALAPDEQAALDAALAETPALADAFARWRSLRAAVRADLARALPDRALLVLYALADEPDALSADEARQLGEARPALDAALDRHPGLAAAVRRIRADRDAFDAAWQGRRTADDGPRDRPPMRLAEERPAEPRRPAGDRPALRRAGPTRWAARVAAVVAVVSFGALATWLAQRDAGWETLAGAQTVAFADGTTVQLADGARLAVPEGRGREARLEAGRALFRVERDPEAPFEVTTPNAEVTVLGTTFAVEATDVETEVLLVEGAVTLAPRATPGAAVRLGPGQRSRVLALDAPSEPAPADLGAIDFAGSVFVADGTAAGEIARRLAARFGVQVAVDGALASEPMSRGEYGADGLGAALAVLAGALDGRVVAEGDGFRIVAE